MDNEARISFFDDVDPVASLVGVFEVERSDVAFDASIAGVFSSGVFSGTSPGVDVAKSPSMRLSKLVVVVVSLLSIFSSFFFGTFSLRC